MDKEISDFLKFAIENNRIKDINEAFEEFPPKYEWHQGKIENVLMEENKEIKKAQEELEYLTGDEEERRIAFLREKAIRDEVSSINGARKEGEKNKQLEIAKSLLNTDMPINEIGKHTGLSISKLEEISFNKN